MLKGNNMRKEQLIVTKIQQLINSLDQTQTPEHAELAEQYSNACKELNSRLEQCVKEISGGAYSNAIQLAETEPPIMELVELLEFNNTSEWNELCEMYEWAIAPKIKTDLLKRLDEAYRDQTALEPLLNEYRKKVKDASLKDKIFLLRRIKEIDSKNPQREEDLVRFENARLKELKKEARQAIEEENETAIQNVYNELISPNWYVKPPENVITKLSRELAQYRKLKLKAKGDRILHEINNAYSNFEFEEVKQALQKWDMLIKEKEFIPEQAGLNQVKEARIWFDEEQAEMKKTSSFKSLQKQIADDIEHKRNLADIDNKYYKLQEFGKPIPETLTKRYHQYRNDIELDAHRKSITKIIAVVLIIIIFVAGLGYFIHLHIKGREYRQWTEPILETAESSNLEQLQAAVKNIEQLKEQKPDFYDADIVQAESVIHSRIQEINARMTQFNNNLITLNNAIKNKFKNYDQAIDLIKQENILLERIRNKEKTAQLDRIKKALKAYEIRTQDDRDEKFRNSIVKLNRSFTMVQLIDAEKETDEYNKKLKAYETESESILKARGITPELKNAQQKMIAENITSLKKELARAKKVNRTKKKMLKAVRQNILPLTTYKLALTRFAEKFPEHPATPKIRNILKMMSFYLNAAMMKNFNPITFTKADIEKYSKLLKNSVGYNIWRNDINQFIALKTKYLTNAEQIKKELNKLKTLMMMKYKVLTFKDKKGNIYKFYTEGKLKRKFSQINDHKYWRIKTKIVVKDGMPAIPYTFSQGSKGWKITSKKSTLYTGLKAMGDLMAKLPLAAHVTFCTNLNFDIASKKPEELQLFLSSQIENLKNNNKINSFIKLQFIKKLLSMAKSLSVLNADKYKRHEEDIQNFINAANGINWLNISKNAAMKIEKKIKALPDFRPNAEKEIRAAEINTTAVGRRLQPIGVVQVINGLKSVKLKPDSKDSEIWVLQENKDKLLNFEKVGIIKDGQAKLSPEFIKKVKDMEPVFAPGDDRSTRELADKFKLNTKNKIIWPESWPANIK